MGNKNLTSTSTPNPAVQPYYNQLLYNTSQLAQTPYTPFTGQGVAPVNQQQYSGIQDINQYALSGLPLIGQAAGLIGGSAQPLTSGQIQTYENPYQQNVVGSTEAWLNNLNAQQQQQVLGNSAAQGALGGNRTGIAQGVLAGQQAQAEAPTIAGLESTGYNQAVQLAMQQYQQNPQAAAYGLGNLGQGFESAALTGSNAITGAGTLEQQTQQAGDVFNYQQYLNQLAYPFQLNQYAAGITGGIGSLEGGQTTTPGPSLASQIGGLGLGAAGLATLFSDRRLKEDVHEIGKTHDGQPIYRYRFRGHPQWHMGLMAQEVEKDHPEAVGEAAGYKTVDIKQATDGATRAAGGPVGLDTGGVPYGGGGLGGANGEFGSVGSTPYSGGTGYIPSAGNMPHGSGPPQAPSGQALSQQANQGPQQMMQQASQLSKLFGGDGGKGGSAAFSGLSSGVGSLFNNLFGQPFASDTAIYYKGGPVRAGMGLSSFMPRRFADGGAPDKLLRLPNSTWKFDKNGYLRKVGSGPNPPPASPPLDIDPNSALPQQSFADGGAPDDAFPPEITQGVSAPPMAAYQDAIAANESGGNYSVLGKVIARPDGSQDRAYGKYQVMGANIPQWTTEALGQPMTPQQFVANPEAQDAVFQHKFGKYVDKYGPEGAARAWFAGEGGMNNPNARDVNGTSVDQYGQNFTQALGFSGAAPSGGAPGVGGGQQTAQDILNSPDQQYVKPVPPPSHEYSRGDIGQAMLAAGLGMMASGSHFPLQAIGQGGLQGVAQLGALRKQEQEEYKEAQNVNESVARLNQQANFQRKQLAINAMREDREARKEQLEEHQPKQIGMGPMGPIYGIMDPTSGGFRIIDPQTGTPGSLIGQPGGQLGPQSMAPPTPQSGAPQAQPAVLQATDPAKFAPPDIVKTQFGNDDAAAGLRNVYATDQNPTAGLNPQALKALSEDPFAQQNPGIAARAIAIAQGRAPILPTMGRSAYLNQYLDNKAYELNPMLDGTTFQRRQRTENFYAVGTQGGGGQNIVALNRWLAHSGSLLGLAEKMNMGDYTTLNQAKIELAKRGLWTPQLQDQLGAWDVNATGVAGEAAKVFTGSNPALADREGWEKILTPDTPLHTIRAKLQQAADMGEQALNANVANYNEGMRTNHNPREFMTQRSQQILDALKEGRPISSLGGGASKEVDPRDAAALKDNAKNPAAAAAIDRKYGAGTAARLLGTQ